MPVVLQCEEFALTNEEANRIWQETIAYRSFSNDKVIVRCVSETEIQQLNSKYRKKDAPTNVLTFSYDEGEHDIALCLAIARQEAQERGADIRDYVALLLVHAFLHATDMDHERSQHEEEEMQTAEKYILEASGFSSLTLFH